jgi:hypothetical protein
VPVVPVSPVLLPVSTVEFAFFGRVVRLLHRAVPSPWQHHPGSAPFGKLPISHFSLSPPRHRLPAAPVGRSNPSVCWCSEPHSRASLCSAPRCAALLRSLLRSAPFCLPRPPHHAHSPLYLSACLLLFVRPFHPRARPTSHTLGPGLARPRPSRCPRSAHPSAWYGRCHLLCDRRLYFKYTADP